MKITARTTAYALAACALALSSAAVGAHAVSAHEVYVLDPGQVSRDISAPPFDMVGTALGNLNSFAFWAFLSVLTVFCVFWVSTLRKVERALDPFLLKLRPYAPAIARATIGLSFLAGAYYQASYGPEMPFSAYGPYAWLVTVALVFMGASSLLGFYSRIAAWLGIGMYAMAVWMHGWYMLTYANYLGELIVLAAIGSHGFSLDGLIARMRAALPARSAHSSFAEVAARIKAYVAPRSFAVLRVMFGVSFIYASAYAKIIHNRLALDTVMKYHLDKILGFEPHFLVLGAAIIELLIGVSFIIGVEIRFVSLFMLFWLTLSLFFFGEAVWPHLILIGIPIAFVCYGYDRYSIEGYFFRKKRYEPVL